MKPIFTITNSDSNSSARTGILHTDHGDIITPCFIPVGTYGAVKTQSSEEIAELPSPILLSNTYHLYLRPGTEILKKTGGLHKFMNWNRIILTDSGGFQIFSLEGFRKVTDEGVTFRSHLDGSEHHLTPEKIVDIQRIIGSDFMMMLDVCPAGDANFQTWLDSLNTTTNWAKRSMKHYRETESLYDHFQVIIPIVQGGTNQKLREKSAKDLLGLDLENYAIGGLAVGEPKNKMLQTTEWMNDLIPREKSRYLMGVGTPIDIIECVKRGVDMFDCVIPTRNARNSQLFTYDGTINIRNACYKNDYSVIDTQSKSPLSQKYTKAYLHHLFRMNEILGLRIATTHNLHFYIELMKTIQIKIAENCFETWSNDFINQYNKGDDE